MSVNRRYLKSWGHQPAQLRASSRTPKVVVSSLKVVFGQEVNLLKPLIESKPSLFILLTLTSWLYKQLSSLTAQGHPSGAGLQKIESTRSDSLQNYSIRVVFEPCLQSVPKIASGPTQKKIVAPKNNPKKTATPIEYIANRHVPLSCFLLIPFIDPDRPATPNSKKTIAERYKMIKPVLTVPLVAASMTCFLATFTQMVTNLMDTYELVSQVKLRWSRQSPQTRQT